MRQKAGGSVCLSDYIVNHLRLAENFSRDRMTIRNPGRGESGSDSLEHCFRCDIHADPF